MTASRVGYQYVVLRCVPRVDRDEFINVGVVLYSQATDFLGSAFAVNPERLGAFAPDVDLSSVDAALQTIGAICRGEKAPGRPSSGRSLGQRFGWLAAPRSTVVQPGPVHGGLTRDPPAELERLLSCLVG